MAEKVQPNRCTFLADAPCLKKKTRDYVHATPFENLPVLPPTANLAKSAHARVHTRSTNSGVAENLNPG